jgi:hypothetical protein
VKLHVAVPALASTETEEALIDASFVHSAPPKPTEHWQTPRRPG